MNFYQKKKKKKIIIIIKKNRKHKNDVNFAMISIIHKIWVLLKVTRISKLFLRRIIRKLKKKKKKKTIYIQIKDNGDILRLEKRQKAIKDRILRDIRNVFRLEKEN